MKYIQTFEEYEHIDEGLKDWTIGAALLIMSMLSPSKVDAQISKTPDKDSLVNSIENVINDQENMNKVATYLHDNGYGAVGAIKNTLTRNANNILTEIEENDDVQVTSVQTSDIKKVGHYLHQGYCITQAQIETLIDTVYADVENVPVDTVSIQGTSGDFFEFASLKLTDEIKADLKGIADSILNSKCLITNIMITTGTDFVRVEPGSKLYNLGIHNNQELCEARAKVIVNYLSEIGIDTTLISCCYRPNNLENKIGYQPNETLRVAVVEIFTIPNRPTKPISKEVLSTTITNFKLVKTIKEYKYKTTKIKLNTHKTKVPKRQLGKKMKCPTFK